MSEYRLENIKLFSTVNPNSNYIVLFGVDKVPPHIGFVHKGAYFSESTKGGKTNYDFSKILLSIKRKGVKCIFIELMEMKLSPELHFSTAHLQIGESCLTPIKRMMNEIIEISDAKFVFDLIESLIARNKIQAFYHIGCDSLIVQNTISLPKYDQSDIDLAVKNASVPC